MPHPELPVDDERDHSLLITEAQQCDILMRLVEIEQDLESAIREILSETSSGAAEAERVLAEFGDLAAHARSATRNAITVEERIARLDFPTGEAG